MGSLHANGETDGLIGVAVFAAACGAAVHAGGTDFARRRHLHGHVVGLNGGQNRPHPDEQGQDGNNQSLAELGSHQFRNMAKPVDGCKGKAGPDIVAVYI